MLHLEVALFCLKPRKNPFNWIGPKHQSLLWLCLASWFVIWFMSVTSFKGSMLLRFRDTYFCFCLQTGSPVTELRCHKVFRINFMPFCVNVLFTHLAWRVGLEKNTVSYMKRISKNFSGGYWIPKNLQFADYTPKVSYFIQTRQCQHVVAHHHSQKRLPWRDLMSFLKKMWQIRPTMRMEIISASGNMKHVPTWMFQQQV